MRVVRVIWECIFASMRSLAVWTTSLRAVRITERLSSFWLGRVEQPLSKMSIMSRGINLFIGLTIALQHSLA